MKKIYYKYGNNIDKYKKMGLKIGNNVHIGPEVIIDHSHCWLIEIGDNCTLAPRVHILAHDASTKKGLDYTRIGKVKIGNNTFIGASAIVLPGVEIGENVIIGSGSVVTRDIPDNSLAVGNPAKRISSTDKYLAHHQNELSDSPIYDEKWTLDGGINENQKKQMVIDLSKKKNGYVK
ncbi:acyltransferase [Exiguobacterium sp. s36]|uniref:acyltransferase n=1 Tax=Exiguobacterium sp. s36 TaxID=2751227 RepID=UPI002036FF84|nr:acyltransferase [Exiguobacterium sp. s36]